MRPEKQREYGVQSLPAQPAGPRTSWRSGRAVPLERAYLAYRYYAQHVYRISQWGSGVRPAREDFKVAGKDRAKQLARQKYERQAARRAAQDRKAKRVRLIGGVVAVVVVGGAVAGISVALNSGDSKSAASASPSASTSPSTAAGDGAPKLGLTLQNVSVSATKSDGTAKCAYSPSTTDKGAPKGLGTPPTTPAYKGQVPVTVKTNLGDLGLTLDASKAPCTTNSFAYLA